MNQFPPEPTPPQQPHRNSDEWIAVIVALGAIAAILFWVLGKREGEVGFQGFSALFAPSQTLTDPESPPPVLVPDEERPLEGVLPLPGAALREEAEEEEVQVPLSAAESEGVALVPVPTDTEPAAVPSPEPVEFTDVPEDHWAYGAIITLAQRGIIEGFGNDTFQPDKPITRAEFATLIREVFNQNPSRSAINFEDVSADFWAASDINQAVEMGFMKGYPGQVFRPSDRISRTEAFVALSSGFELPIPDNPQETLQQYGDRAQVPQWAIDSVAAASEAGLVVGPPQQGQVIEPARAATRADVAAMLERAFALSDNVEE
ncbi:MAG: S-layer homology domain-containing protein [Cyanobacteriota bacterium]|nr:S-layer homology domain-containing protein [Cyanobacteriota bacterium]